MAQSNDTPNANNQDFHIIPSLKELDEDINIIIERLVKPIVKKTVRRILEQEFSTAITGLQFLGININNIVDDYIEDGLRYAKSLMLNDPKEREKFLQLVIYFIKKYKPKNPKIDPLTNR